MINGDYDKEVEEVGAEEEEELEKSEKGGLKGEEKREREKRGRGGECFFSTILFGKRDLINCLRAFRPFTFPGSG